MNIRKAAALLFAMLLVCAGALFLYRAPFALSAVPAAAQSVPSAAPEGRQEALPLFSAMDAAAVTGVTIRTPQCTFELRREPQAAVSINGQRGDSEGFATLLMQIKDIACQPAQAFDTDEAPLLTLVVSQEGGQFVADFFDDDATGERARVVSTHQGEKRYGMTDGWRIGTLLLACEGTRIQDAFGKETPVD